MPARSVIHVVDDDDAVRDSLCQLLRLHGYATKPFASGEAFLSELDPAQAGAIVLLDLRLPGKSGLDVQAAIAARGLAWPVIIVTAHGDAASARAALKAGAFDFVEKPFDDSLLLSTLEGAETAAEAAQTAAMRRADIDRRLARLTPRERQVLRLVVDGRHNREVAQALGISPRTVEVYKSRLMDKLDVDRLPDLIRLALQSSLPEEA
ncbi:MAG: sigma-70 family RNA polymerase sigma factor [Burkholderiales bacterium]